MYHFETNLKLSCWEVGHNRGEKKNVFLCFWGSCIIKSDIIGKYLSDNL